MSATQATISVIPIYPTNLAATDPAAAVAVVQSKFASGTPTELTKIVAELESSLREQIPKTARSGLLVQRARSQFLSPIHRRQESQIFPLPLPDLPLSMVFLWVARWVLHCIFLRYSSVSSGFCCGCIVGIKDTLRPEDQAHE